MAGSWARKRSRSVKQPLRRSTLPVAGAVTRCVWREVSRAIWNPPPARPTLCVSPETENAKPGEIVYVNVAIVGENGVVESNADRKLTIKVEGGELLAFGSANPRTEENFDEGTYTTYYGTALAAVRAGASGKMKVSVEDAVAEMEIC